MDLEELKTRYAQLFELSEDGTEFRWFKTKREYLQKRRLLQQQAVEAGCREDFDAYVKQREVELYERYELRQGLSGHRTRPADDYLPRRTQFLWYPYLPLGEYTVLMAAGGTGKTYFCCGVAAQISRGVTPFDEEEPPREGQNVLIVSAEDRGGELRARLTACGADLTKIYVIDRFESLGMSLSSDIEEIRRLILRAQAKLVIFDPWQAYIGSAIDINKLNALRPLLQQISNLARSCDCSIVLVSHVNKRSQSDNINHAAIGSTDLVNASRSVLALTFAAERDERLMVHTKSNYSAPGRSILFAISEEKGIEWRSYSDIGRSDLENASRCGKTVAGLMREREDDREMLLPLAKVLQSLAETETPRRVSYREMRSSYGDEIFCDMQPIRALRKALETIGDSGIRFEPVTFRRKNEDGNVCLERGFEIGKSRT